MKKLIIILFLAVVLSCYAEEKNSIASRNPEVEALVSKLTKMEDRMDILEKEVEQLRKEVDRLNELTSTLTKTLRALEIATQGGSSLQPDTEVWNSIRKGMTAEDVQELLGSADRVEQARGGDVWYYLGMGSIVFDRNDRVKYQNNFKKYPFEHKVP